MDAVQKAKTAKREAKAKGKVIDINKKENSGAESITGEAKK